MNNPALYSLLADGMLVTHLLVITFIILGLAAILLGRLWRWTWIYSQKFRYTHLVFIAIIVAQAWLGRLCPLTVWEQELRLKAGQAVYTETFIQHWLHRILFFEAEMWIFGLLYTAFGGVILACWLIDRKRLNH
ncbi:MAG: DUF2784 domain-containing protein [Gammaproteobacteria bacterium]|jgi:hypothetical protein|nr:hypothetical protein [Chromatiales bacterium]MDP6149646.1 DUF2784 domain-containing protein [Gammaproteobacteria bacterium]MDP7152840.1 DUF2784 domain-containing protein [Gammaproteobacteria bacterium]MDP7270479.1 DUF2784 domain-containing protein [Gammaproteobacteria bacterium]HJP04014.1 DUF2784 domain-containing protein [Gammaproteobacteria bacterium]